MDAINETKLRIERAAVKLFVKQGFAETSIKEIAREAGISQGAMYNHFASKEQLGRELFMRGIASVGAALHEAAKRKGDFPTRMRDLTRVVYEHFDRDWQLFDYCFRVRQRYLSEMVMGEDNPLLVFRSVIATAMAAGEIPRGDKDLSVIMVTGAIMQVVDAKTLGGYFEGPLVAQAHEVADACTRLLGGERA